MRQHSPSVRTGIAVPGVVAGLLLAGCGGSVEGPAAEATPGADELALVTAVGVAKGLGEAGLPVRRVAMCTPPAPAPEGHPRPRAAAFDDLRVSTDDPRRVIREGGVVEVYDSPADVRARLRQLDEQALAAQSYGFDEGGQALQSERRLTEGKVLLRLSGHLRDRAVSGYAKTLRLVSATTRPPDLSLLHDTEEAPCST
jgi:hypothetical protein